MKRVTYSEVEVELSQLLIYTILSTKNKLYDDYKDSFSKMLDLVYKWTDYYAEDFNLNRMSEEEIREFKMYLSEVPSNDKMVYLEKIKKYIDSCSYYASVPINTDFDDSNVKIKGKN